MDLLKRVIKEVEVKVGSIKDIEKVLSYSDYKLSTNSGYNSYYPTKAQEKRIDDLLSEFREEMIQEVLPTQQKLTTLEQLLGQIMDWLERLWITWLVVGTIIALLAVIGNVLLLLGL